MKKMCWAISAVLVISLLGGCNYGKNGSEGDIALYDNDFVIYYVDCGSTDTDTFSSDMIKGSYQSVTDKKYGKDPVTKKKWGLVSSKGITPVTDSLGTGTKATRLEIDPYVDIEPEKDGIGYSFEVPKGKYEVTVGFYNPFSTRKIDVIAEEELKVEQQKIIKFDNKEYGFEVEVNDGRLDLLIANTKRGLDRQSNPIVSYIVVRCEPEYSAELLEACFERNHISEDTFDRYTEGTLEVYCSAREKVEKIISNKEAKKEERMEGFKELTKAYKELERKYETFKPGEVWLDTDKTPIQAHGGHVQKLKVYDEEKKEYVEKWWWVGEDKTKGYRGGINAYSSSDLYNWKFEGTVMRNVDSRKQLDTEDYFKELYAGYTEEQLDNVYMSINSTTSVIERPKVIFNEKTETYVMWFHADGPTKTSNSNYAAASAGVAVSKSPYGPFRFVDRYRLNVCPEGEKDYHPDSKGMARDMNLFIDDDGTAYIIYSSEENYTLYISKLNDEYTYLATDPKSAVYGEDFIRIFPGGHREAPALFKRGDKYYLMTSGCTGWDPNQASYAVSDSIFGNWVNMGDPCVGDTSHTTFDSQSTCIFLADAEKQLYIYMGDRWFSNKLNDSRYLWLPIEFDESGKMTIKFVKEWAMNEIEK